MKFKPRPRCLVLLCCLASPAFAHHSFGGTYDVSKELTVKGKIVQVTMRSPHSMFIVQAMTARAAISAGR